MSATPGPVRRLLFSRAVRLASIRSISMTAPTACPDCGHPAHYGKCFVVVGNAYCPCTTKAGENALEALLLVHRAHVAGRRAVARLN